MFSPATKVLIHTPGALLVGVVTHVTTTTTVNGSDTRHHVIHWDNVIAGEASIIVTDEELSYVQMWDTTITRWLGGKGATANRFADDCILALTAVKERTAVAA